MEQSSPNEKATLLATIIALSLLSACQQQRAILPTPTDVPATQTRETWPSLRVLKEGNGSAYITLARDDLPISLTLTGEDASGWLVLYVQEGEVQTYQDPPPSGREASLRILSLEMEDVIPLEIKADGSWRILSAYLDRGNFMEIPGRMSGSGPHIVFFTLGTPRYVEVKADPGQGLFALYGISEDGAGGLIAASTDRVSEVFALSPELRGLQVRVDSGWTVYVVDRADILE